MKKRTTQPVDLRRLRTFSIARRAHKVARDAVAGLPPPDARFAEWWKSLPDLLATRELRAVVDAILAARRADRPVVFALGAHVVKAGCSPIIVDLIQRGLATAVAVNGATALHDAELTLFGETSEEVGDTIHSGRFGMVRETAGFFAQAAARGATPNLGLGAAIGELLRARDRSAPGRSILAAAHAAGIPATVHVALGTDTVHMHPQVDAAQLGAASATDFRLICAVVADMAATRRNAAGGVWCNVGSAVLLPEVFLKAVAVARNLGHNLDAIHTANFDMIRHYRPRQNVIGRPVRPGHGHEIVGHHELMLPLLRQALLDSQPRGRAMHQRPRGRSR